MTVNWDDLVEREFKDPVTGQKFKVNLMVKDAIWIELLKQIVLQLRLKNG